MILPSSNSSNSNTISEFMSRKTFNIDDILKSSSTSPSSSSFSSASSSSSSPPLFPNSLCSSPLTSYRQHQHASPYNMITQSPPPVALLPPPPAPHAADIELLGFVNEISSCLKSNPFLAIMSSNQLTNAYMKMFDEANNAHHHLQQHTQALCQAQLPPSASTPGTPPSLFGNETSAGLWLANIDMLTKGQEEADKLRTVSIFAKHIDAMTSAESGNAPNNVSTSPPPLEQTKNGATKSAAKKSRAKKAKTLDDNECRNESCGGDASKLYPTAAHHHQLPKCMRGGGICGHEAMTSGDLNLASILNTLIHHKKCRRTRTVFTGKWCISCLVIILSFIHWRLVMAVFILLLSERHATDRLGETLRESKVLEHARSHPAVQVAGLVAAAGEDLVPEPTHEVEEESA